MKLKTLHPLHPLHLKNVSRKPSHMSVPQRKAANTPTPICPFTLHVNNGILRCITAAYASCIGFTHESEGCTNVLWSLCPSCHRGQLILGTPRLILDAAALLAALAVDAAQNDAEDGAEDDDSEDDDGDDEADHRWLAAGVCAGNILQTAAKLLPAGVVADFDHIPVVAARPGLGLDTKNNMCGATILADAAGALRIIAVAPLLVEAAADVIRHVSDKLVTEEAAHVFATSVRKAAGHAWGRRLNGDGLAGDGVKTGAERHREGGNGEVEHGCSLGANVTLDNEIMISAGEEGPADGFRRFFQLAPF